MNQRVQRGRNLSASYEPEVTQLNSGHKNGSWTIATSIAGLMEEGALRAVPTVTASSRVSRYACAARHCGWVDVSRTNVDPAVGFCTMAASCRSLLFSERARPLPNAGAT